MNFNVLKEVNSRGGRYCACVLPTAHAYQILTRVSYMWGGRGGGGGGGGWNSPPENLEIEYGYYCFVTGIKQQSCPRLRQEHAPRPP